MGGPGIELRQYYRAVVKRLWLVLLLMVAVSSGVYLRTVSQPPQYAATATLMVTGPIMTPPTSTAGAAATSVAPRGGGPPVAMNDIIQLFSSRPITERVARTLGLEGPSAIRGRVVATPMRATSLIKVRATSSDRAVPARLANVTTQEFIAYFHDANRRDTREIRLFVERQLVRARADLEASDAQIEAYKEQHGIVSLEQAISQAAADTATIRADLRSSTLALKEVGAKLAAARAQLQAESTTRVAARTSVDNPVFQQLQARLTALEMQRAEFSQVYTERHPRMQQIEGEIAAIGKQLSARARSVLGEELTQLNPIRDQLLGQIAALEVERASTAARLQGLSSLESRRAAAVGAVPGMEARLNRLLRENGILEENYRALSERRETALLRENEAGFIPAGLQVMEAAVAPTAHEGVRWPLRAGLGALIGLFLGVMAALFLETADDRIRSAQDAERTLGAPVLAEVPDMAPARVAPGSAALVIGLVLTMMLAGSVVAARTSANGEAGSGAAVSLLLRVGRGIDGLTTRLGQAIR